MNKKSTQKKTVLEMIENGAETLAAVLTLIAATLIFVGVLLRNLFSISPSWITEVPTYAFVWAVFLALARAFSRGPQLGLDIVVRKLPLKYQKLLHGFGAVAMLVIALLVAWLGVELCARQFSTGAVSNTALRFSLWMVTCSLALGFTLLAFHALARLLGRTSENTSAPSGVLE